MALGPPPDEPSVSVLIPNYNYERFLSDAIESVRAQTYERVETVVCDDGSTDGSRVLLEEMARRRESLKIVLQENGKQAAAMSAAFAESTGDVIVLLDADDLMRRDKVEKVVAAFKANPDAGMVIHQMMRVDENKKEQGIYPLASELPQGWLGPEALEAGGYVPWIEAGIMSLRREVADRIFPLPSEAGQFSDVILRGAGAVLAPVVTVPEPLAYYRLHDANSGNTARTFGLEDMLERRRRDLADLETAYSALAELLRERLGGLEPAPFETTRPYLERRYVIACLAGEPKPRRRELLDELMGRSEQMSPRLRAFYRLSPVMPRPVFKAGLEFVYGQGRLKAGAARAARALRRS